MAGQARFLKMKEVIEQTGFSRDKLYCMIHEGLFTIVTEKESLKSIVRKIGRDYCFDREEFEQWYSECGRGHDVKVSNITPDMILYRNRRYIITHRRSPMPNKNNGHRRYGFPGGIYKNQRVLNDGTTKVWDFWFYNEKGERRESVAKFPDGRRAKTQREAEHCFFEKVKEIAVKQNFPSQHLNSDSILFKDFVDEYLEKIERDGCKSVHNRACLIRGNMIPVFDGLKLEDIDYSQIERYKAERSKAKSRTRGTKIKNCTINAELRLLRHMLNIGERLGYRICEKGNPVQECKNGNFLKEDGEKRDKVLTREEMEKLVECSASHLKPVIAFGWHTGMRKREILGMKWENVDLEEGFVYVPEELSKNGKARYVPLEPELLELLFELKSSNGECEHVFTFGGEPINDITIAFRTAMQKAEIEGFVFHGLRHSFITRKLLEGVNPVLLSKVTGNTVQIIMSVYEHLNKDDLKQVLTNGSSNEVRRNFGFGNSVLVSTGEYR